MDAFSEILSGVKLNGAVFFNAEFSDPWGFASPASQTLACTLAPGAPHVVIYHLLTEGCAIAQTADGQAIALEPGDVVIFPHGDAHLIRRKVSGLRFGRRGIDEFGILSCQPGTYGLSSLPVSQRPEAEPDH